MRKATFEEEFPSLEGKGTDEMKIDCMNELIFHYKDIQKYCLDTFDLKCLSCLLIEAR